jgi:hypothetical protein
MSSPPPRPLHRVAEAEEREGAGGRGGQEPRPLIDQQRARHPEGLILRQSPCVGSDHAKLVDALGQVEGVDDALVPDDVAGGEQVLVGHDLAVLQELDAGEAAIVEGRADHLEGVGLGRGAHHLPHAPRHHETEQGRRVGEELVDHVLAGEPGGCAQPFAGPGVVGFDLEDAPEPHIGVGVAAFAEEVLGLRHEHVDA